MKLRISKRTYILAGLIVVCAAASSVLYVARQRSPTPATSSAATEPSSQTHVLDKQPQPATNRLAAPKILASLTPPFANGLITNEYAYWNQGMAMRKYSPDWQMTSGSLYAHDGVFWTGKPDTCDHDKTSPDATSTNCTDSSVFRLNTAKIFAGNISVSLKLRQLRNIHNAACDADDTCWYGTHIWLRYQNQFNLYYVSINRADGNVAIKRKVPCGTDNSGTYFVLGKYVRHNFQPGAWNMYTATIQTNQDGSVTIKLYDDSDSTATPIDVGTDRGGTNPRWSTSCKTPGHYASPAYQPITAAGAVGVRGDYAEFEFTNFKIAAL